MIKRFGVRNLKGIEEAELELRPITILIGSNGSGKSTITQALMLLKQSMEVNQLLPEGSLVNFGDIQDLFLNRDVQSSIQFLLEGEEEGITFGKEIHFNPNKLEFVDISINTLNNLS